MTGLLVWLGCLLFILGALLALQLPAHLRKRRGPPTASTGTNNNTAPDALTPSHPTRPLPPPLPWPDGDD